MQETTTVFTTQKYNSIIIIKNTPCTKCTQCGKVHYSDDVESILASVTDYLYETTRAELFVTDYKSAVLVWDPDYTKVTEYESGIISQSVDGSTIQQYHVHCPICTKAYDADDEMEICFNNHTELETLRWITNCIHNDKIWQSGSLRRLDYTVWEHIDAITEKFNITDNSY